MQKPLSIKLKAHGQKCAVAKTTAAAAFATALHMTIKSCLWLATRKAGNGKWVGI